MIGKTHRHSENRLIGSHKRVIYCSLPLITNTLGSNTLMKTYVCFRLEILIINSLYIQTHYPFPLQLFQSNPWNLKSSRVYLHVTKKILMLSGMNSDPVLQEESMLWTVISTTASFEMSRTDLTFQILLKTKNNNKKTTCKQQKKKPRC